MTDTLVDRVEADPRSGPATAGPVDGPAHRLVSVLLVAAGLIHAAMAPSHLEEAAVEGAGFVLAAWVQLGLAIAVVLRPARRVLVSVAVASAALIAAWVVSRTAGLPFGDHAGHAESVSLVDGVAVGLEAATLVLAGVLLAGRVGRGRAARPLAVVGSLGAVVLATAAVTSPSAADHAVASHGRHGDDGTGAPGGAGAGHDDHGATEDDLGFSLLSNGHEHDQGFEPMTPDETVALMDQLAVTVELVREFPTIGAAEAAGWRRAGPFAPGLGTHYSSPDFHLNPDGRMDTREDLLSPMLVFDGLGPDAPLAGFMYLVYGNEAEPEGFAGPNDRWHHHESVCIVTRDDGSIDTPFGADLEGVTAEMCAGVGGAFVESTGYMVHVWNVPGYESPDGMFSELNRRITCPDGTYHRIPLDDLGSRDTACARA